MLGWTVSVDEIDREAGGPSIAYWYADPQFLTEMEELIEQGEAFLVESNGGYPYKFDVYSDILRDWLEDGSPKLHRMFGGSDPYNLRLDYGRLDQVSDGVLMSVVMWDQS